MDLISEIDIKDLMCYSDVIDSDNDKDYIEK